MTKTEILPRVKLDEAVIERIKRGLGDDDGDVFACLWVEYLHLRMCFHDLKNGFGGDNPPMIPVWAAAQEFEKRYRNLLVEAIVLAACRLTDNHTVGGKKTISISVLPGWFAHEPNLKKEMKRLVDTATTANEPKALRTWRNRQLAHTAKDRKRTPVSGDETEAVVDSIREALAFVWNRRLNEESRAPAPEAREHRPRRAPLAHAREDDRVRSVAVEGGQPRRCRRHPRRGRGREAPHRPTPKPRRPTPETSPIRSWNSSRAPGRPAR